MNEQLEISKRLQDIKNMKELESLMELADMIDQIQCISQEYSFHASLGKTYRCAKFLNVQGVVVNMRMSTDLLFKVASVADYFSMSSGERISMVKTVQECLSNATQTMESFNEISRNSIKADAVKSYYRDRYYGRMLNHKKLN
ncbi:MAG: hypothetical protein SPJ97_00175 [Bacteroides sp.]|nr:hypothetical protein [Bacteroides sp.]